MRKSVIQWIVPLTLLLQSCGTVTPTLLPEATPTASLSDVLAESTPGNPFIPYGKNIRFEQISLEEGLSQSVVNTILQDRKGFLWVGTDDGLNRYDGYTFTVFKPDVYKRQIQW